MRARAPTTDWLEASGFARATISMLARGQIVRERLGRFYRFVDEIVDDYPAPIATFVSKDSGTEGEAAVVSVPLYIGGIAGGLAVIASGGAMASAFAAAAGLGVVGAGVGGLLARMISHRHIEHVWGQLAQGGLVLWGSVRDDEAASLALEILIAAGASNAYLHELDRRWSVQGRPVGVMPADPFLRPDQAIF